jgi:predicted RNA-binding protein YlqC (UPF0109 family)
MSEPNGGVRTMLEQVVRSLVDQPAEVSVEQIDGEEIVFELTVAESDMGKVIGRQGRVARALRALVSATGVRANKRHALEILE